MKRLEFHISYLCNHACIFCSEYDRMTSYKKFPLTALQIKTILVDRRKKGFNHVNFTGGEPTLVPGFLKILEFAKKLGYTIYVGTNGTMFASEDFSEVALQYIDELSISVHWFDEASCEKQTGLRQHFQIYKLATENIKKYKKDNFFFCNIVLNRFNYKHVGEIIHFVYNSAFPVQQILISNIAPEGIAEDNFQDLVFDLRDFKQYIPNVVSFCSQNNIIVRFFGLPTCILSEEYEQYANDAHWEERHTIERFTNENGEVALQDIYSPDNSRKRIFDKNCAECHWKMNPCTGVFQGYLDFFEL